VFQDYPQQAPDVLAGTCTIMWVGIQIAQMFCSHGCLLWGCAYQTEVSSHNQIVMCGQGADKLFRSFASHVKAYGFVCPGEGYVLGFLAVNDNF